MARQSVPRLIGRTGCINQDVVAATCADASPNPLSSHAAKVGGFDEDTIPAAARLKPAACAEHDRILLERLGLHLDPTSRCQGRDRRIWMVLTSQRSR